MDDRRFRIPPIGSSVVAFAIVAWLSACTHSPDPSRVEPLASACPPGTPASPEAGCPALTTARGAVRFVEPFQREVEAASAGIGAVPGLGELARPALADLADGRERIATGLERVTAGDICGGAADVESGAERIRRGAATLDAAVAGFQRTLRSEHRGRGGDADDRDFLWHEAAYRRSRVTAVDRRATELASTFVGLCDSVRGRAELRGLVVEVNDVEHTIRLDSGVIVVLADTPQHGDFGEGSQVRVSGVALKDETVYAAQVMPAATGAVPPLSVQVKCLDFRIAPPQAFSGNVPPPNLTLHEPSGYLVGERLWLEAAMRMGVERHACPKLPLDQPGTRQSMKIQMTYEDKFTKIQMATVVASDLTGTEAPVPFPPAIEGDVDAKIVVTLRAQTCEVELVMMVVNGQPKKTKKLKCGPTTTIEKRTWTARVREAGSGPYFTLEYAGVETDGSTVLLALDDNSPGFVPVELAGVQTTLSELLLVGTSYAPEAQGFLVTDGASSKPNVETIEPGDTFAVYNRGWELDSTYPVTGLFDGLVKGTRNGHPFWYTAGQPSLVSDVVAFCNSPDSYYRLPWHSGGTVAVGQGNDTSFTHKGTQKYAFDFSIPDGHTIYAPRGGWVTWIVESLTQNSNPNESEPWQPANALRIEHQDGTASWYYHMQPNGVLPELYTKVHRGSQVGITGNTGNSTGPHLHYQVQDDPAEGMQSTKIRFQAAGFDCLIPSTGDQLVSNNSL